MTRTEMKTLGKIRGSVKAQALAAAVALVAAVALPQLLHLLGAGLGIGSGLGEQFLPMHLPILLVGFLAGPWAGAVSGFLAPLASVALTGMPGEALLPFMVIELSVYGLSAGLLSKASLPVLGKVIIAQVAGRAVRAAVILLAVPILGLSPLPVSIIWTSIPAGFFGLALQWILIPAILYWVEKRDAEH